MTNLDEKQQEKFSTEQSQHAPPEFQNNDNGKNKKMSKKKKIILTLSISIGVLLAALGVFAFSKKGNTPAQVEADTEQVQVEERPIEPESERATPEATRPQLGAGTERNPPPPTTGQSGTKFDLEAIKRGDFASLQGSWENEQFPDRNFVISGNTLTFASSGNSYQITMGTSNDGSVTLAINAGIAGAAGISIFPVGIQVLEWLVDGTDELGRHDLTDNSRDRLMIWQGLSTPEEILENIVYRA
ncbi:MAG: DUF6287 domain-containing protein [Streptococcaceae bacterium]|jgi:hypothetical protein|nr:DUF6287 domain-containing protein [Streptococcaceae bacterium]